MFLPGIYTEIPPSPPKKKNLTIPQTAAKLCAFRITLKSYHQPLDTIFKGQNALNLVFGRGNELQIYFGNIFQSTINTGHYSSLSNQNSAKFMPKMYRNTFGGRAPPEPAGEFMRSSRPSRRNGGPTSKGRDGRGKGRGPTSNGGAEWRGVGRERKERGMEYLH